MIRVSVIALALCCGFCASYAQDVSPAAESPRKSSTVSPTAPHASSDGILQKEVTVDAKGVKTLKLIGNDPNFGAEHMQWLRDREAQTRAQNLALAAEQRKQAEAEAKAAEALEKASADKAKTSGKTPRKLATPKKNKRKPSTAPVMTGGGTVPY